MSAFRSGLLTMALALGVVSVRFVAVRLLRIYGFRTGLLVNGILCALGPALCALLTQSTPVMLVAILLYAVGFTQGFQFTALMGMTYSEVPPGRMSAASSFSQVFQQLSQGAGVAITASLLHAGLLIRGADSLATSDFVIALLGLAAFELLSLWSFWTMAPDAGIEVTRHRSESARAGA
jgi:MFS family permease